MLDLDGVHVCEQPVTVRSTENCPLGDVAPRESPEQAAVTSPHHEPGWAALLDLAGDLPLLIIGHHMSRRRLSSLAALAALPEVAASGLTAYFALRSTSVASAISVRFFAFYAVPLDA
jgi:hypothetical protein